MPELPEVETVVRTLENQLHEVTITSVDVLWDNIINQDIVEFKQRCVNQTIHHYKRKGKYLILECDDYALIAHLRMEGKFYIQKPSEPLSKHIHVIFHLSNGLQLRYHDTRKFGKMAMRPLSEHLDYEDLKKLGKDALEPLDAMELYAMWHHKKIHLKKMLLDQSFVAGIGNIYANEICFSCGLHPASCVNHLSIQDFENIVYHTQRILNGAVKAGGTTIRSYTSSLGVTGLFQLQLKVHGLDNQPCVNCQTLITKMQLDGRGTYLCQTCQIKK